ncbi:triose-phosphate isomerase [Candidatus Wolfebacteria bacterium]|nr:triose-phosphate isomerase [Candidatus Wolfebacteria bacterium]
MARRGRLVVANWKMHPGALQEARRLFSSIARRIRRVRGVQVVVCPPALYLSELVRSYRGANIRFGAQDVSWHAGIGAYTGELSAMMLKRIGAGHVIVGHSERRAMGESDKTVSTKVKAALDAGLAPILCVGEEERDHEGGYLSQLEWQLTASLDGVPRTQASRLVVAYEPVWAIGKRAQSAVTPRLLHETVIFVKKILSKKYGRVVGMKVPILYGGSVEGTNAGALSREGAVDGFLVGHASLSVRDFVSIVKAC